MYGYIYLILNKVNGKTYVGKHKLHKKTWQNDNYMGSGILLKPAQEKYGIENFEKFLITYTESEEDAREKEKFWIAHYKERNKAEYNIAEGGSGGITQNMTEFNRNPEIIKKRVDTFKKNHPAKPKPETSRRGSDEWRKKNAEAHKGKPAWNKGLKMSDDWKKEHPNGAKGHKWSSKGYRATPEQIENNRRAQKEYWSTHTHPTKGRKWYTNGEKNVMSFECPEGYWKGITYARR